MDGSDLQKLWTLKFWHISHSENNFNYGKFPYGVGGVVFKVKSKMICSTWRVFKVILKKKCFSHIRQYWAKYTETIFQYLTWKKSWKNCDLKIKLFSEIIPESRFLITVLLFGERSWMSWNHDHEAFWVCPVWKVFQWWRKSLGNQDHIWMRWKDSLVSVPS